MKKLLGAVLAALLVLPAVAQTAKFDEVLTSKKSGSRILEVLPGASVFVYNPGCTTSAAGIGTTLTVYTCATIQVGDTIELGGQTATVLTVPNATTITTNASMTWSADQRIVRTNSQVTLYKDLAATSALTQPLTADSSGRVYFYTAASIYDVKTVYGSSVAYMADEQGLAIGGGGGYSLIQDEGGSLPQQSIIDFQGQGVSASAGAGKTIVTIAGGGAGGNFLDVRTDCNAAGDGATDDTDEIRACVQQADDTGRTVYFPAGTYLVTPTAGSFTITFQWQNGIKLMGAGPDGAIVKVKNNAGKYYCLFGGLSSVSSGAVFEDIAIDHNIANNGRSEYPIPSDEDARLSFCVLDGGASTKGVWINRTRHINLAPVNAITINSPTSIEDSWITNNTFENYGNDPGLAGTHTGGDSSTVLTDSAASWVADTFPQGVGHVVINQTDGSRCNITDNDATTITCAAGLTGGTDNTWQSGDVYWVWMDSAILYVHTTGQGHILNNRFAGVPSSPAAREAIETHSDNMVISGNAITDIQYGMIVTGVDVEDTDNVVITDNVMQGVKTGIYLWPQQWPAGGHTTGWGFDGIVVANNLIELAPQSVWNDGQRRGCVQIRDAADNLGIRGMRVIGNHCEAPLEATNIDLAYNTMAYGWYSETNADCIGAGNPFTCCSGAAAGTCTTVAIEDSEWAHNTALNFPGNGIRFRGLGMKNVSVKDNLFVNTGSSLDTAESAISRTPMVIWPKSYSGVEVTGNIVVDDIATTRISRGVWLGADSGAPFNDVWVHDNHIYVTGATDQSAFQWRYYVETTFPLTAVDGKTVGTGTNSDTPLFTLDLDTTETISYDSSDNWITSTKPWHAPSLRASSQIRVDGDLGYTRMVGGVNGHLIEFSRQGQNLIQAIGNGGYFTFNVNGDADAALEIKNSGVKIHDRLSFNNAGNETACIFHANDGGTERTFADLDCDSVKDEGELWIAEVSWDRSGTTEPFVCLASRDGYMWYDPDASSGQRQKVCECATDNGSACTSGAGWTVQGDGTSTGGGYDAVTGNTGSATKATTEGLQITGNAPLNFVAADGTPDTVTGSLLFTALTEDATPAAGDWFGYEVAAGGSFRKITFNDLIGQATGTLNSVRYGDGSGAVSSPVALEFDQQDGFVITNEGAGVVQVDLGQIPVSKLGTDYLTGTFVLSLLEAELSGTTAQKNIISQDEVTYANLNTWTGKTLATFDANTIPWTAIVNTGAGLTGLQDNQVSDQLTIGSTSTVDTQALDEFNPTNNTGSVVLAGQRNRFSDQQEIFGAQPGDVQFQVRGASGQTANLLEVRDFGGTTLFFSIDANGIPFFKPTATPLFSQIDSDTDGTPVSFQLATNCPTFSGTPPSTTNETCNTTWRQAVGGTLTDIMESIGGSTFTFKNIPTLIFSGFASDASLQLGTGVIGAGEIASNAVTGPKILSGAVDSDKIADGSIAAADLAANAVDANALSATAIQPGDIEAADLPADGYASTYINAAGDSGYDGIHKFATGGTAQLIIPTMQINQLPTCSGAPPSNKGSIVIITNAQNDSTCSLAGGSTEVECMCTELGWEPTGDAGSGGSGDEITVGGSTATNADFNNTVPSAPAGTINVQWQITGSSPSSISANVPYGAPLTVSGGNLTVVSATGSVLGALQLAGDLGGSATSPQVTDDSHGHSYTTIGSTTSDNWASNIVSDETGSGGGGVWVFNNAPVLNGPIIGTAGVSLTGDGDGAIIFLGLGDGSDESLTFNFDDTADEVTITSSTGVNTINFPDNSISTADLKTEKRSMFWGAGAMSTDGTGCTGPVNTVTINSGRKGYTVNCPTDGATSIFYFDGVMPDGWDGANTLTFELNAVNVNATPSGTYIVTFSAMCDTPGTDTMDSTWGTGQTATVTFATQYRPEAATTANVTPNGSACSPGDILSVRGISQNGTTTQEADIYVLGVKMEYTTDVGD